MVRAARTVTVAPKNRFRVVPAGGSVRVGAFPEGILVDQRAGLVVVGVRNPSQLVLLDARSGRVVRRVSVLGAPRHRTRRGRG